MCGCSRQSRALAICVSFGLLLQPDYGSHPVSFHVFFRLQPPAGSMGHMWNVLMSQPMAGHQM
jgi:hypothetical protein